MGIYKKNTGKYIPLSYGEKGISDIIGLTKNGKFLAVEVKMPKKKPSKEQLEFIEKVKENGGIAFVAYGLEDVEFHLLKEKLEVFLDSKLQKYAV